MKRIMLLVLAVLLSANSVSAVTLADLAYTECSRNGSGPAYQNSCKAYILSRITNGNTRDKAKTDCNSYCNSAYSTDYTSYNICNNICYIMAAYFDK